MQALFGKRFTETTIVQRHELYTHLHLLLAQEEALHVSTVNGPKRIGWVLGIKIQDIFIKKASHRQRSSRLYGLFDEAGQWHESKDGMASIIMDYFQKLFDSTSKVDTSVVLRTVSPKVTVEMNQGLLVPFSKDEDKTALFSNAPY